MAKKQNDYFKLLQEQISYAVNASDLLLDIIENYNNIDIKEAKVNMHAIEHEADGLYHDILDKLSAEFITVIDQEDILHLVQSIDDITDALDESVMYLYMYHIKELPSFTNDLVKVVNKCVKALNVAIIELRNYKKSQVLDSLLVDVSAAETEADKIYTEAIYNLFESDDPKKLITHQAVYECLENCCDLCDDAKDLINQIIIKNT